MDFNSDGAMLFALGESIRAICSGKGEEFSARFKWIQFQLLALSSIVVTGNEVFCLRFIAGSEVDLFPILDFLAALSSVLNEVKANVQLLMIMFKTLRTSDVTVEAIEN